MSVVLVAPVPAEVLASAISQPRLREEVAFGTRQRDLAVVPGARVFIYAAPDGSSFRSLLRPGFVTWSGVLGAITPAIAQGPRRGMHPNSEMRPPFAETYDYRDAAAFWHVLGLAPLNEAIPFACFRDFDGAKLFGGYAPQWISRGVLTEASLHEKPRMRRAA